MHNLEIFDEIKAEITLYIEPALKAKVQCAETQQKAMQSAQQIKKFEKLVEQKRKELVGPINDEVKRINSYAKQIMMPLLKGETHLKNELISWEQKLEIERREKQRQIELEKQKAEKVARQELEAAQKKQAEIDAVFGEATEFEVEQRNAEQSRKAFEAQEDLRQKEKEVQNNKVKGVSKVWTWELVDADKVPKQFLIVNEKALNEAVRAGAREIQGVRIYQKPVMSIRS